MKKTSIGSIILMMVIAGSIAASCVREDLIEPSNDYEINDDLYSDYDADDGIIKGWIRIKLEPDAEAMKTGIFTRGDISTGNPKLDAIIEKLGVTEVRRTFTDGGKFAERRRKYGLHLWYDLKIDQNIAVTRAQSEMRKISGVAFAEPIVKIEPVAYAVMPAEAVYVPSVERQPMNGDLPFDDPYLKDQWHYNNDGSQSKSVAGADINLFEGWKTSTGDPDVIVAVIDMGVDFEHEDLAANMWVNEAELNGQEGVDDDGNGFVDDIYGANFATKSSHNHYNGRAGYIEPGNHGTHVAGTIAAVNNNGIGVCGIAGGSGNGDGVRIMSCQIFDTDGTVNQDDFRYFESFLYAADHGAVLANCSFTVSRSYSESVRALDDAMLYFVENAGKDKDGNQIGPMAGGVIICCSGNYGTESVFYPGKSDLTICVGSILSKYGLTEYSERGVGVDILAPGGDDYEVSRNYILSTYPTDEGKYGYMVGTSMACPHVTGVAALIASHYKGQGFTNTQLQKILKACVRPAPGVEDTYFGDNKGVGLVDCAMITAKETEENPSPMSDFTATPQPAAVELTWSGLADANGYPVMYYSIQCTETALAGDPNASTSITLNNTTLVGEEIVYHFEGKSEAEYTFSIYGVDRYGKASEPVSATATTLEFENHPPVVINKLSDMKFYDVGDKYARTIYMPMYFQEKDTAFGDYMTFTLTCSDQSVVRLTQTEKDTYYLLPVAKGECTITFTATDTRNATTEMVVPAVVSNDNNALPTLIAGFEETALGVGENKSFNLNDYFQINELFSDVVFTAESDAPQVAQAQIDAQSVLSVKALAAGTAHITVTASIPSGNSISETMVVVVGNDGNNAVAAGDLSVSPNPADDVINLNVAGVSNASVAVSIYDSGMRAVYNSVVKTDDDGSAQINVAKLVAGIYHVRVNVQGKTLTCSFVKK